MALAKIEACIVCEAVRPELFNKTILLGFFGLCPHTRVVLRDVTQPATVWFVFSGGSTPIPEKFTIQLSLIDPNGLEIANEQTSPPIKDGFLGGSTGGTNVFLGFHGVFGRTGAFRVGLLVNGEEHFSTVLQIDQGLSPSNIVQ